MFPKKIKILVSLGAVGLFVMLSACGGEQDWIPGTESPPTSPEPPQQVVPPSSQHHHPSALQSVVSQITLPSTGTEHGMDLDDDGVVDNQIGRILGQVKSLFNIDMQPTLGEQIDAGKAILLYDVLARSLMDDTQVQVRAYLGVDKDGDPADNFSGAETFTISGNALESAVLPATIVGGKLASTTPGPGLVSLPFISHTTVLPLRNTQIQATVGPDGMRHGILAGAIPMDEAVSRLGPVLAKELNRVYQRPDQLPATVELLRYFLDQDRDGTITTEEFSTSNAFGFLLHSADIDTDEDGQLDAISFGISFKSVPCTIQTVD